MVQLLRTPTRPDAASGLRGVTAAILAGGLGTRLRPALADCPKVLAPVGGRPFLFRLLDVLAGAGIERTILLTGHLAEQVEVTAGKVYAKMALAYSREAQPLGTGGALRLALPLLDTPTLLLVNGDSYCRVNLRSFAEFHRRRRADLSMVLAHVPDASAFGRAELDFHGVIRGFAEKQTAQPGWVNAGLCLLQRDLVSDIPAGRPVSLERDMMPDWIERKRVVGYRSPAPLIDIGTPDSYARAQRAFGCVPPD
jgi:D-glycero-alpha-D-manno-heptose 1-phosphate guanylyltransferase